MRLEFHYNRGRLLGSLLLGMAVSFGIFLLLWGILDIDLVPSLAVLALLLLTSYLSLGSPLFTCHVLTREALHLRYGLVLRARIPIADIASANLTENRPLMEGVSFSVMGGALYVTTEPHNLVAIKLRRRRRFPAALWKSADTIVLSVSEPRRLMEELRRLAG